VILSEAATPRCEHDLPASSAIFTRNCYARQYTKFEVAGSRMDILTAAKSGGVAAY